MSKGNQGRRGAQRVGGGPSKQSSNQKRGSGGKHRRALGGRGSTPKAEDRTYHPAHQRQVGKEREAAAAQARAEAAGRTRVKPSPGCEIVVGRGPVFEAAEAGLAISRVFATGDPGDTRLKEIVDRLGDTGAPVVQVTRRDLEIAADGSAHQGIAIEVPEYEYADLDELLVAALEKPTPGLLVALDHVTDPHNVGAVLRSSAAFGADGMILPTRRSAGINVTAWKVSAGAAAKVRAARVNNLVQALQRAKDAGFFVVGLEGKAAATVRDFPLVTEPLVLVTGSEGAGLSRLVAQTCDQLISITAPGMESLNASVATSIALYEIAARRGE